MIGTYGFCIFLFHRKKGRDNEKDECICIIPYFGIIKQMKTKYNKKKALLTREGPQLFLLSKISFQNTYKPAFC